MPSRYQATQKGGPLELVTVSKPVPARDEVLIRVKAVALNPIDSKQFYDGLYVASWPATFGNDGAGVVEEVGEDVKGLKSGDEVFAMFTSVDERKAAFQDYVALNAINVGLKPKSWSWEDSASLPVTYITAASAIHSALKIPLSFLPGGREDGYQPKSVLVLGGSSGVGASAIQLLRFALPDATILATSSPKHHDLVTSRGANAAFDYRSSSLVEEIKKASPSGEGVEAIVDAVNGVADDPSLFEVLIGPKYFSEVATGTNSKDIPADVEHTLVFGRALFSAPGGSQALAVLGELIESGKYQLPVPVTIVGKGYDAIGEGLETLQTGVSATKLVVSL